MAALTGERSAYQALVQQLSSQGGKLGSALKLLQQQQRGDSDEESEHDDEGEGSEAVDGEEEDDRGPGRGGAAQPSSGVKVRHEGAACPFLNYGRNAKKIIIQS